MAEEDDTPGRLAASARSSPTRQASVHATCAQVHGSTRSHRLAYMQPPHTPRAGPRAWSLMYALRAPERGSSQR